MSCCGKCLGRVKHWCRTGAVESTGSWLGHERGHEQVGSWLRDGGENAEWWKLLGVKKVFEKLRGVSS